MNSFSYASLDALVEDCCLFYRKQLENKAEAFSRRRKDLVKSVQSFHENCGTLTDNAKESIEILAQDQCILLMTAHQPNLFAYGGVLRKAVLNHVIGKKVSEKLKIPVVSFFGLADQDFADDRWVRCAVLPDVERRSGVLELRADLPEKVMLCRTEKIAGEVLNCWHDQIMSWLLRNLRLVDQEFRFVNLKPKREICVRNFEHFWSIVEQAYSKAECHSDFNAFVMSKIVNDVWELPTLFARFSECQRIFGQEFAVLLSRFDEYSRVVREAESLTNGNAGGGVYDSEFITVPFWVHCDCGSKARLTMNCGKGSLVGVGECMNCEKKHQIRFDDPGGADISEYIERVSARSIAMPIVFFQGLGVSCYVGGEGGRQYLLQAKHVMERMFGEFPIVAIWRPHDIYRGVGQCAALLSYRNLSGKQDFSEFDSVVRNLKERILDVRRQIDEIQTKKQQLMNEVKKDQDVAEELRSLISQQAEIRRCNDYTSLTRRLGLIENVQAVVELHPCIIDYAVSVGLKDTGAKWITFLEEDGDLSKDVSLSTCLDEAFADSSKATYHE